MFEVRSIICMVGLLILMSLSELLSCVDSLRFVMLKEGWINLLSVDWE